MTSSQHEQKLASVPPGAEQTEDERRRAIKLLVILAVAAGVSVAALIYFAGIIAGAIVLGIIGLLINFGNWVLNNAIELR